jgi:ferredoxin
MGDAFLERQFGTLTLRIDRQLCVGFGDCVEMAAELFELDDEGIARFCTNAPGVSEAALLEVCRACPVDALVLLAEDGRQLAP